MTKSKSKLLCHIDGLSPEERDKERTITLEKLGLLEAGIIPVFEEATQTAARFLESPICILSLVTTEEVLLKSAVGLSKLGLMNQLATERKLARIDSFSSYVVEKQQKLNIDDTIADASFASNPLVQHFAIRSYLGIPLITVTGVCIGTLEVMDLVPREFTSKDIEFLTLTARWCLREFEQNYFLQTQCIPEVQLAQINPTASSNIRDEKSLNSTNIKIELIKQLKEKVLTPLTSVIGMASVLRREVYGNLNTKQKEYLEIIHSSGQNMILLVEELVNLGILEEKVQGENTEIEILCQQVLASLSSLTKEQNQDCYLSVDLVNRPWLLDKEKIKPCLFYLLKALVTSGQPGNSLQINVFESSKILNISVLIFQTHKEKNGSESRLVTKTSLIPENEQELCLKSEILKVLKFKSETNKKTEGKKSYLKSGANIKKNSLPERLNNDSLELLGLLLSCSLAESHGGNIILSNTREGDRYIIKLPKKLSAQT